MTAERGHDSFTSEDGDTEVTEPAAATPTPRRLRGGGGGACNMYPGGTRPWGPGEQ